MTNVEARLRIKGKEFQVLVDVDKALQLKRGLPVNITNVMAINEIFYDIKKGLKVSSKDLQEHLGANNVEEAAEKIIKSGEIVLPSEYKKKEVEEKKKQVIDFLLRNAVDPATGNPHSETRIKQAFDDAGIKIENKPIEQQIQKIITRLNESKELSIKIETKKLKVVVPAVYTGQVYGLLNEYKEKEEWLNNGDLSCIINIPSGLEMDFYDKLNAVTHGSAVVEAVKK